MDADTILEKEYFEKIMHKFETNKKLGIASGGLYHEIDGKLKLSGQAENFPSGTGRVWSKECFFDTDCFSLEPSADSISNVKAILRGWHIQRFNEIQMVEKRLTSSAQGLWNGYKFNGYMAYYLNKNPILILLNVFNYTLKRPHYTGIAFLLGYIKPVIKNEERISDREIREYYWNYRIVEYKKIVISRQVGDILLIAGSDEALKPFKSTQATFLVDSLDDFRAYLEEKGAKIIRGPAKVPTGKNMTIKHPDGSVIEYVEHSNTA